MTPATVEKFLNGNTGSYASGCTNSNQASCKAVAPISVQTPVYSIKLANQRWNPKFDPFCDDRNNNGRCDCFVAGTSTLKDPDQCTLMDDAAEPTLSQAPYSPDQPNADDLDTLFRNMGGLAGADLHLVRDDSGPTMTTFNGQYLQLSQLWFDVNGAFQCQYLASSETSYRTPAWLNWSDFGASNHGGCPATHGGTTASGGPVRLMKPIAANNTFAVSRPNTLIKMINYATKSSGQGISISRTEKKFTFDEAMALVALRRMMPVTDVAIHQPGITTPSASSRMRGTSLTFENVYLPDNQNNNNLDFVGAVLRAISYPADL